jgi:cyclopropane fatty-acyl-phospholipid synthase-like methyltransferase
MGATLTLRDRLYAWWEGIEPIPAAEDDAHPQADEEAAPRSVDEGGERSSLATFRERFIAWWEGYELPPAAPAEEKKVAKLKEDTTKIEPARPQSAEERRHVWNHTRIRICERIWGAGFVTPGGTEHVMKLVKPFALNPKMSYLDLGAGLGGGARAVADAYGMWVTAMEPHEVLAEAGMEQSTLAGMAKKAPVIAYDPESIELRANGFDCIFAKEVFYTVVDKRHLFSTIVKALKSHGQMIFTDYLLAKTDHMEDPTKNWAAHEPIRPEMWSVKQMREHLEKLKLEIRIEDDMSKEMCDLILQGWLEAIRNFRPGQLEADEGMTLLAEAELWARRLAALESGDVRLYRMHVLKR